MLTHTVPGYGGVPSSWRTSHEISYLHLIGYHLGRVRLTRRTCPSAVMTWVLFMAFPPYIVPLEGFATLEACLHEMHHVAELPEYMGDALWCQKTTSPINPVPHWGINVEEHYE